MVVKVAPIVHASEQLKSLKNQKIDSDVVLDVSDLGFATSMLLNELLEFHASLVNAGHRLIICCVDERVRGILATAHVFLRHDLALAERDLWKVYRTAYKDEPFVRIVKERQGVYRYPEPKILAGSNYADVGFALDQANGRVVTLSAIDNLMKGAAGSAVQAMNLMCGFEETAGLGFPGLHPI